MTETCNKSRRIVGLDIVRTAAILLVVLNHAVEGVYPLNDKLLQYSLYSQIFSYSFFTLGRLGVPLFLFLTGSLMLNKTYDTDACICFWKKKWLPLLLTWELWIVLYNICNRWIFGTSIHLVDILRQMMFLKDVPMKAGWYMPMILGLYLFIPFVSTAIYKIKPKVLLFPLVIGYIYCFFVPLLQLLVPTLQISSKLDLSFGGKTYGIYILMGYLYSKLRKKFSFFVKFLFFLPMFLFTISVQVYFLHVGSVKNVWYTQALVPLMGLLLFSVLSEMSQFPFKKICTMVSFYSFGIYLVHIPVLQVFMRVASLQNMIHPLRIVICFSFTFAFSFLLVFILSKIPNVKKIAFNID